MTLSNYAYDRYVEPHFSKFRTASIPELNETPSRWLQAYILNKILHGEYKDITKKVFNLLRRIETAHLTYKLGRTSVIDFLSSTERSVSTYMNGLFHWESFLAQCGISIELLWKIIDKKGKPTPNPKGTIDERVCCLYNRSKHVAGATESQNMKQMPADYTVPVWMENDGLHSVECLLTWDECYKITIGLSKFAYVFASPKKQSERLDALKAEMPLW